MVRRPFCGMAAGLLSGILAAAYAGPAVLFAAPPVFGAAIACAWVRRRKTGAGAVFGARLLFRAILILAAFFWGWHRYRGEERFSAQYLPGLEEGKSVLVQGRLDGKELRGKQYIYQLSSCVLGRRSDGGGAGEMVRCGPILVYSDSDPGSIGEILVLEGTIKLWGRATNEGGFDAQAYHRARGFSCGLAKVRVLARHGRGNPLREGLSGLRLRLREVYLSVLGEKSGGVLAAMALGDKSLLDAEIKGYYQTAGLSHILAVSGLHVSVIGMSVYGLLRRLAFGYAGAGAVSAGLMYAYALLTGLGTSVQRASGMFFVYLLAQALGRGYDSLNALGLMAFVLLCRNPFLFGDAGFLFSFVAVAGIVWAGGISTEERRAWGKLRQTVFPAVAVQLATLPLVAWFYFEIPVFGVFVNLLALPFVGVVLGCGVAGGFVGLLSLRLSRFFLFPCRVLLAAGRALCAAYAGLPGAAWIAGRPHPARMVLYYALFVAAVLYRRDRRRRRKAPGMRYFLLCLLLPVVLLFPVRGGFELDVLDVGQGDACFLRTGAGQTVFVDGGSSDVGSVGTYRILPFLKAKGVRKIDYWFVSHLDADHISGLTEVLTSGYRVKYLVFSEEIDREEKLEELCCAAEACGTRVLYLMAGDILHLGEARIRVLYPADRAAGADRNAGSLVFLYEEGAFRGIFTGDIGRAEEQRLLAAWPGLAGPVDFYKAAHHGSDGSGSAEFLKAVRPAVSVVSCGRENRYGHPGGEALRRMREAKSRIYLTMDGGRIRVRKRKGQVIVEQYRVTQKRMDSVLQK